MDPAKYIMDSRVNTKACTTLVKTARNIMGRGARNIPGQEQEDGQDQIFPHDIAEKTQSQGEHPGEVADDLNGEEQGRQGRDGSQKVLDILGPVVLDPQVVGIDEGAQGQGQGVLILAVGEKNPGSRPIRLQNMMNRKTVQMIGEEGAAFFAGDLHHELFQAADDQLKDVLGALGHQGNLSAGQQA